MSANGSPASVVRDDRATSCCTGFYEQDWVRQLAEDHFHPGGAGLTRRTVESLGLPAGSRVADLGCGSGTSARLMALEYGLEVTGVDLSAANLARAMDGKGSRGGPEESIRFVQGDVANLALPDRAFHGLVLECVLSLIDKPRLALDEMQRVLHPGGAVALTDMVVSGELPDDMLSTAAAWTCLLNARNPEGYEALFTDSGFRVEQSVDESASLQQMLRQLKRKLLALGTDALLGGSALPGLDLKSVKYWLDRFGEEVRCGRIRYHRFLLR